MGEGRKASRNVRGSRLRSAIEFLTSIPLGSGSTAFPSDAEAAAISAKEAVLNKPSSAAAALGNNLDTSANAKPPLDKNRQPVDVDSKATKELAGSAPPQSAAGGGGPPGGGPPGGEPDEQAGEIAVRLRGFPFRHITSRGHRSSKLFKDALLRDGVLDGRIAFARNKGYPTQLFSIIKYDAAVESAYHRDRQAAAAGLLLAGAGADESLPAWLRWKGRSYAGLLHAEHAPCSEERDAAAVNSSGSGGGGGGGGVGVGDSSSSSAGSASGGGHPSVEPYNPLGLDDPSIDLETQRFTLDREGYIVSILAFRNERSQKDEINARFARSHPWLDTGDGQSLTLSKIRSLKKRALHAWWGKGWEVSSVALAVVYFERLVYKRLVNKGNRKLAFSTCLLLAWKMNEAREGTEPPVTASEVVTELEAAFSTPRKNILRAEFPVFMHLRFGLAVPTSYAAPHMERLLLAKGATSLEYFGPALHAEYAVAAADEGHTLAPSAGGGGSGGGGHGASGGSSRRDRMGSVSRSHGSSVLHDSDDDR